MEGSASATLAFYITFYVALSLLSVLWAYSIIWRFCYGDSQGHRNHPVVSTISLYLGNRGLGNAIIERFPKFAYSSKGIDANIDINMRVNGECVVCLGAFEENEMLRLLPKCGHVFHIECIDKWLQSHVTCPLCRANLLAGDYPPQNMPYMAEV